MLPPHSVRRPFARTAEWELARLRDADSRADGTREGLKTGIVHERVPSPSEQGHGRSEDPERDRLPADSETPAVRATERDG
jgi:hypothetical protein